MEKLLEDSFRCDGFDNTPFTGKLLLKIKHTEHLHTVTREGGQLFQCSQAAHFLDDEGLEVYLQNWNEGRGSDSFFYFPIDQFSWWSRERMSSAASLSKSGTSHIIWNGPQEHEVDQVFDSTPGRLIRKRYPAHCQAQRLELLPMLEKMERQERASHFFTFIFLRIYVKIVFKETFQNFKLSTVALLFSERTVSRLFLSSRRINKMLCRYNYSPLQ